MPLLPQRFSGPSTPVIQLDDDEIIAPPDPNDAVPFLLALAHHCSYPLWGDEDLRRASDDKLKSLQVCGAPVYKKPYCRFHDCHMHAPPECVNPIQGYRLTVPRV